VSAERLSNTHARHTKTVSGRCVAVRAAEAAPTAWRTFSIAQSGVEVNNAHTGAWIVTRWAMRCFNVAFVADGRLSCRYGIIMLCR
jgi:hypothetical protein